MNLYTLLTTSNIYKELTKFKKFWRYRKMEKYNKSKKNKTCYKELKNGDKKIYRMK